MALGFNLTLTNTPENGLSKQVVFKYGKSPKDNKITVKFSLFVNHH